MIATSGETGTLVSTLDYDAFGNERTSGALAGDTHGDFRLHGMWKDPSGLYYVRARVYDAETGRFTSFDAGEKDAEIAERFYPYTFARHNAYVWADPSGSIEMTLSGLRAGLASLGSLTTISVASFAKFLVQAAVLTCSASYVRQPACKPLGAYFLKEYA